MHITPWIGYKPYLTPVHSRYLALPEYVFAKKWYKREIENWIYCATDNEKVLLFLCFAERPSILGSHLFEIIENKEANKLHTNLLNYTTLNTSAIKVDEKLDKKIRDEYLEFTSQKSLSLLELLVEAYNPELLTKNQYHYCMHIHNGTFATILLHQEPKFAQKTVNFEELADGLIDWEHATKVNSLFLLINETIRAELTLRPSSSDLVMTVYRRDFNAETGVHDEILLFDEVLDLELFKEKLQQEESLPKFWSIERFLSDILWPNIQFDIRWKLYKKGVVEADNKFFNLIWVFTQPNEKFRRVYASKVIILFPAIIKPFQFYVPKILTDGRTYVQENLSKQKNVKK